MIKLEHVVLASPEQMEFIIEGVRNPMNSWEKGDSELATAGYDVVGFHLGEAVKYISRAGYKDEIVQDLKKAQQFIQFEIDYLKGDKE